MKRSAPVRDLAFPAAYVKVPAPVGIGRDGRNPFGGIHFTCRLCHDVEHLKPKHWDRCRLECEGGVARSAQNQSVFFLLWLTSSDFLDAMASYDAPAYFASAVVAVLTLFLTESADTYWTVPLGMSPNDVLTPSLLLGTSLVAGASYLPTPYKYGLQWGGAIALLTNLKRWAGVQQEYFGLTVIAVLILVGLIYAHTVGATGYFAENYYNHY